MKMLFGQWVWLAGLLVLGVLPGSVQAQVERGKPAPEIALPTPEGTTLSLSSLKGKLVLIDFWASWCGPCRSSNKAMAPLYRKYYNKGFEILGVSLDDNTDAWKKAIRTDKIAWKQVNQTGGWEARVARDWNIEELPTTFLVDTQGNLLAKNPSHEQLETFIKLFLE